MRILREGDTFSGLVSIDECTDLPDHEGSLIITKSEGNAVRAQMVSKVKQQVRSYALKGFVHVTSRILFLVPVERQARSLSLACRFTQSENEASCEVLRDNFSHKCGNFNIKRDYTGESHRLMPMPQNF